MIRRSTNTSSFLSRETWVFLCLTIVSVGALFSSVDLRPHVDNDFFFSTEDPTYQADNEITKLFTRKDDQIIISVSGDIYSESYSDKIHQMTKLLSSFSNVSSVISITQGPNNIDNALKSPLWKRILVSENDDSTNVVMILKQIPTEEEIQKIESVINIFQSEDFFIRISGFPYVVELVRRYLLEDLKVFTLLAFLVFGILVNFIFHSWRILLGMFICCCCSCAITFLLIYHFLGIKIGLLTANLATIIFVLTLSHIVFLTFNWRNLKPDSTPDSHIAAVKEALAITLPASFWSMFTTLLGFISLLFVQAKPLRELGISGALGTAVSFIIVYSIYPSFLRLKKASHKKADFVLKHFYQTINILFEKFSAPIVVLIMLLMFVTSGYLGKLNTDPHLIAYFKKDSDIREGLTYIDKNGGSSPMVLVVKSKSGELLTTNKIYEELWQLQLALEKHNDVGIIISLPTLLAEGKRLPLGFLIPTNWLLDELNKPKYERISSSFISQDRQYGLYLLRMNELTRTKNRLKVIDEIKDIVNDHGFTPHLIGGIYALQGHLSQHIAESLIYGLGRLILVFTLIAFIVSRSLWIGISMTLSLCIVPMCILGGVGYFGIPLDTISAPAANIAIAMGIDSMIHMVHMYRRINRKNNSINDWIEVRSRMFEPIFTSMFIICCGFGIFFLSSFPPTQRFGGSIVFGTAIAAMTALYIFPLFASRGHK